MTRKALILMFGLALGGCANHPLDCSVGFTHADCLPGTPGYQDPDKFAATDDKQCQSYGLQPGTTPYADCRIKLSNIRPARCLTSARRLAHVRCTRQLFASRSPFRVD